MVITLKLHAGCLFIPMLRQLACSDCYLLFIFFVIIFKIFIKKYCLYKY